MKKLFLALTTILFLTSSASLTKAHRSVDLNQFELAGGAYLVFAGQFGGDLTSEKIASTKQLTVEGCAKGAAIHQFDLQITKNGKTSSYHGKANELTAAMHKQLKQLSKGDEFTFDNIKACLPKGETVDVWAKKFIII